MASAGVAVRPPGKADVHFHSWPRGRQPGGSVEPKQGEFLFLVCLAQPPGHQERVRGLGLPQQGAGGCIQKSK